MPECPYCLSQDGRHMPDGEVSLCDKCLQNPPTCEVCNNDKAYRKAFWYPHGSIWTCEACLLKWTEKDKNGPRRKPRSWEPWGANEIPIQPLPPPPKPYVPPPPAPIPETFRSFATLAAMGDEYGKYVPVNNPMGKAWDKREWTPVDAGNLARIAQSLERIEKVLATFAKAVTVFKRVALFMEKVLLKVHPRKRRSKWEEVA